jgi:hypothetical protein
LRMAEIGLKCPAVVPRSASAQPHACLSMARECLGCKTDIAKRR